MTNNVPISRPFFAILLMLFPALAAAECEIYSLPSICDPAAQDSQHWIGEYAGNSTSFLMTVNNMPFNPGFQETGMMTLFEMDGNLGFVGGGGFEGTAELSRDMSDENNVNFFSGNWAWLADEIDTIVFLQSQHIADTEDPRTCPLQWWPRWTGTYQPPNSPVMNITLIATTFDQMFGRVHYSGQENGARIFIDSRFTMRNVGFDPTGYEKEAFAADSLECQIHCQPGSPTFLCAS